eukprot:UN05366
MIPDTAALIGQIFMKFGHIVGSESSGAISYVETLSPWVQLYFKSVPSSLGLNILIRLPRSCLSSAFLFVYSSIVAAFFE